MNRRILLLLLITFILNTSCVPNHQQKTFVKCGCRLGEVLYSDDFSGDLSNWLYEGVEPVLNKGKMELDTPRGTTVWFKSRLEGDILIEYDVTVIDRNGPNDRVSDLNCFWMATDPIHPDDLFAASEERAGIFSRYHNLHQYYVGYGGNTNSTTRFRRYHNGNRNLLGEYTDPEHALIPNHLYHIQIVCYGNLIEYYCDGERLFHFEDPQPYRYGHFGLRTTQNHLTMDNFKVWRIISAMEKE